MAERCIKGDYIGFTFGGVHSSELGLMRVSDGSRYNQDLLPPLQDKTAQVNGRDGAVYFGSQYNIKPIKVPVAFDNMTEESFNQLKRLLQDKKPKYLWFDETPYKQWLVKSANAQSFKWVCFDESKNGSEKRIYKGEGTLEFSCFSPYAESRVTFLDEPIDSVIFKANGKLSLGTTPYLEILTIENGKVDRQLFSSEEIGDNIGNNKRFIIKEADNLVFEDNKDNYEGVAKKYVSTMTKKGYITFAEKIMNEKIDITDPSFGFYGRTTANGIDHGWRIAILDDLALNTLKNNIKTGDFNSTINIVHYGIPFKYNETLLIKPDFRPTHIKYHPYNFVAGETYPFIFLYQDKLNNFKILMPIYDKNNLLIGVEENTNISMKILSLKGGIKKKEEDSNVLVGQDNTLINSYNYYEWVQSSGLRKQKDVNGNPLYNSYNRSSNLMPVYNAGDIPTDYQIIITKQNWNQRNMGSEKLIYFSLKTQQAEFGKIGIKPFSLSAEDDGIIIDSKLKMIKGYKIKDGKREMTRVYNKQIKEGDFFKIPVCGQNEHYEIGSYAQIPFEIQYKHHYI